MVTTLLNGDVNAVAVLGGGGADMNSDGKDDGVC